MGLLRRWTPSAAWAATCTDCGTVADEGTRWGTLKADLPLSRRRRTGARGQRRRPPPTGRAPFFGTPAIATAARFAFARHAAPVVCSTFQPGPGRGSHGRPPRERTQGDAMSKPLQGRHFIDTQEWTRDELELAARDQLRPQAQVLPRRAARAAARPDAVHAVLGAEHAHAQLVRGRHDPAGRPRPRPEPRQAAGQPRRDGRGHGARAEPHGPRHRHPQLRLGQGQRLHPQRGRASAACRCSTCSATSTIRARRWPT